MPQLQASNLLEKSASMHLPTERRNRLRRHHRHHRRPLLPSKGTAWEEKGERRHTGKRGILGDRVLDGAKQISMSMQLWGELTAEERPQGT